MRTEEEREGIIEDIMRSSIEAGEFLDALDSANEQNEKLKLKIERYEKALNYITTRNRSAYLSTSDMNQDFIKVAIEALI